MNVIISYEELSELLTKKSGQDITLSASAHADKVKANYTRVLPFIGKQSFSVTISLVGLQGQDIILQIEANGIAQQVVAALIPTLISHFGIQYVESTALNRLAIHLGVIPEAKSMLEQIILHSIHFFKDGCIVETSLKL